jgi:hypothetical protein
VGIMCMGGECDCPGQQVACAGACVNTDTSEDHCGACDTPCAGSCVGGNCM